MRCVYIYLALSPVLGETAVMRGVYLTSGLKTKALGSTLLRRDEDGDTDQDSGWMMMRHDTSYT